MDIEQLKLIVETFKGASADVVTVVTVVLVKDFVLSCVGYACLFYAFKRAGQLISSIISNIKEADQNNIFVKELSYAIGTHGCSLSHKERTAILEKLAAAYKK